MKNKICLYGASGHGKVLKDIAISQKKEIKVFFDDNPNINELHNINVLSVDKINEYDKFKFVISIGNNKVRKKISQSLEVNFETLIHKTAIISNSTIIKEGTVIMPLVVINAASNIGKHCIINTSSVIEHDCKVGNYVHISPNATLTGGVIIEEGVHVGAGAIILPGVKVGKWAIIGAGAVIVKDVPDYAIVVGNPGKVIKNKEEKNG